MERVLRGFGNVPCWHGIIIVAENLNIVMHNESAAEILSVPERDLIGRNIKHLPLLNGLTDFFLERKDFSSETIFNEKNVLVNLNVLKNEGEHFLCYLVVVSDISEFRRLQDVVREQERLAVIGRMAAGIVHELRNPMTAVKGFAQLLKERRGQETEPYISFIIEEIDNCARIIGDFLKLARPNPPCLERRSLNETISEIAVMIEPRAFLQNVKVEAELVPHLPECLFDATQLKQVLLNMVDNALEAMTGGGTLRLETFQADFAQVGVAIQDTGCGIPENLLKKIWLPFFSTKENGTGLGLFICRSIIQAHGGKIEVKSKTGEGTTFRIFLPLGEPSG